MATIAWALIPPVAMAAAVVLPSTANAGPAATASTSTTSTSTASTACSRASTPDHRVAVAVADAWQAQRWQRSAKIWITSYRLKPAPSLPLGIAAFKNASALTGEPNSSGLATKPISGLAAISNMTCATTAPGPDGTYIVRYVGRGLTFNENGEGWSRPLARSVIAVLEIRLENASGTLLTVTPVADAPIALPPDAELTLPSSEQLIVPRRRSRF